MFESTDRRMFLEVNPKNVVVKAPLSQQPVMNCRDHLRRKLCSLTILPNPKGDDGIGVGHLTQKRIGRGNVAEKRDEWEDIHADKAGCIVRREQDKGKALPGAMLDFMLRQIGLFFNQGVFGNFSLSPAINPNHIGTGREGFIINGCFRLPHLTKQKGWGAKKIENGKISWKKFHKDAPEP